MSWTNDILKELKIVTSRSGGKGGQHVNKVATKVELHFDVPNSKVLTQEQKERLLFYFKNRLTNEGILILKCDSTRSQLQNKKLVIKRFQELIEKGLKRQKVRKATKPGKSAKLKRLQKKKQLSEKKQSRKFRPDF